MSEKTWQKSDVIFLSPLKFSKDSARDFDDCAKNAAFFENAANVFSHVIEAVQSRVL